MARFNSRKMLCLGVITLAIGVLVNTLLANSKSRARSTVLPPALTPQPMPGQTFANVFSAATSYKAEGFDEVVQQASGTAVYQMIRGAPQQQLVFAGKFRVEGKPQYAGNVEYRDHGKTVCYEGKCELNTEASGLLYNSFLWGEPSRSLQKGSIWENMIGQPWELGPPAKQIMTVMFFDPANHWITLKREGSGEGAFAGDPKQVHITKAGTTYAADLVPGKSHWTGYTTFHNGIVISDELLVIRYVTLRSPQLGDVPATQRRYILLNAMPPDSF